MTTSPDCARFSDYAPSKALAGLSGRAAVASFTLRDLGSRLPEWLEQHPEHCGKNAALTLDMVRLEWQHVVAFDGPAERVLSPEDLLELTPQMTFRLQPYITLLALQYPVDDYT